MIDDLTLGIIAGAGMTIFSISVIWFAFWGMPWLWEHKIRIVVEDR